MSVTVELGKEEQRQVVSRTHWLARPAKSVTSRFSERSVPQNGVESWKVPHCQKALAAPPKAHL